MTAVLWQLKGAYDQQRTYDPTQQQEAAQYHCVKVFGLTFLCQPTNESGPAEPNRDNDDLRAQQEMADWAFGMVWLSTLGMLLSFVGPPLIYLTFRATRQANQTARRIGEAQTRAYLLVTDARVLEVGKATITFRNVGNTPARAVVFYAHTIWDTEPKRWDNDEPPVFLRDIGKDMPVQIDVDLKDLDPERIKEARAANLTYYLRGWIDYDDIFTVVVDPKAPNRIKFRSHFRMKYDFKDGGFVFDGRGTYQDSRLVNKK